MCTLNLSIHVAYRISLRVFSTQMKPVSKMEHILRPPESVYLMQYLDKEAFNKDIEVPVIDLDSIKISRVMPLLRKYLLKLSNLKPVVTTDKHFARVYLNPELLNTWSDFPEEVRLKLEVNELSEESFKLEKLALKYENFSAEAILRSVLPKDKEGAASYTRIGHIVHLNLREHLHPFKNVIGEVLFDKIEGCKSVVNKINMIDNTYRNFQMEILKGDNDMQTIVKENNCRFEFDFSKVYWNSRLATEHERIVKYLKPNEVLFDVFAGVGPFSIPIAKKNCIVHANDLNPESYKWLMHNKVLNKIKDNFTGYNLDGREFILQIVKQYLPLYIGKNKIVITMNLPALAVEFLDTFVGLLKDANIPGTFQAIEVFVYGFTKGENPEELARNLILANLSVKNVNVESKILELFRVRTVSSMKEMMRIKISLDRDILVGDVDRKRRTSLESDIEPKKLFIDDDEKHGKEQEEEQQCFQSSRSKEFENESQS